MAERVTIKTIALDLGISHMTVSRALSGNPNVQKKTRETIVRRAEELGYTKSATATAMRGDGSKLVGLLLPNITNEFYAKFANSMALECEEAGLHLIIHLTNDDHVVEERSLRRLREVQAEAVILVPAPNGVATDQRDFGTMRVVQLIRQRLLNVPSESLLVADQDAICAAVHHLNKLGCRKIGYIGGDDSLSSGRERMASFQTGIRKLVGPTPETYVRTGPPSFETGRQSTLEMIETHSIDGLLCGGFEISNGALSAILDSESEAHLSTNFVGYGDHSFYQWVRRGISTIDLPVEELARASVKALVANTGETRPHNKIEINAEFLLRE